MFKEWDLFKTIYTSVFVLLVVATAGTTFYFFKTQRVFIVQGVDENSVEVKTITDTQTTDGTQITVDSTLGNTTEELNELTPPVDSTQSPTDTRTTTSDVTTNTEVTNTNEIVPLVDTVTTDNSNLASGTIPELTFSIEGDEVLSGEVAFVVETVVPVDEQLILFTYSQDKVLLRQRSLDPSPTRDRWQALVNTATRLTNGFYTFKVGILDSNLDTVIYHDGYTREVFNTSLETTAPRYILVDAPEVRLEISPDLDIYSGEDLNFIVTTDDAKDKELSVYIRSKATITGASGVVTESDPGYYYGAVGQVVLTPNEDKTIWTGQGTKEINIPSPGAVDNYQFFVGESTSNGLFQFVNAFDAQRMYLAGPVIESNKNIERAQLLYPENNEKVLEGAVRIFFDFPPIYAGMYLYVERVERAGTGNYQVANKIAEYQMQGRPNRAGYYFDLDTTQLPDGTFNFVALALPGAVESDKVKLYHSFIAEIDNRSEQATFSIDPKTDTLGNGTTVTYQEKTLNPEQNLYLIFEPVEYDSGRPVDNLMAALKLNFDVRTNWQSKIDNTLRIPEAGRYNLKVIDLSSSYGLVNAVEPTYAFDVIKEIGIRRVDLAFDPTSVVIDDQPTFIRVSRQCVEYGFGEQPELCQRLMSYFLDAECREAGITTQVDCEEFKKQIYLNQACERVDIINEVECQEFLASEYVSQVDCRDRSDFECRQIIQDNFLGQLLSYIQVRDRVANSLDNVKNTTVPLSRVVSAVEDIKEVPNLIPVKQRPETVNQVRVLEAVSASTITDDQELKTSLPYALGYDTDGDGLLDDAEKRYGTDLNNPDTDGDGFLDGEELKNGYNPLGPGEFTKTIVPIDKAILRGTILEQPTTRGEEDSDLVINVINNFENNQGLVFSGLAKPNQVLTIFLYSGLPLVLTTFADEQGQWTYYLDDPLNDDVHDAYVTVTDETGKIEAKSPALSFFVREARAVSVEDYILDEIPSDIIGSNINDQIWRYVIGGIMLVLFALIIFVVIHVRRSKGQADQVAG